MENARTKVILGMIVLAAASRLLPHPPNFTPVGAMALIGGSLFANSAAAFGVPLAAMLLSDAVIGFHRGMPVIYACFALAVCIGFSLRGKRTIARVAGATLASSLLFFVVTNFAVWAFGHGRLYPMTFEGLLACYVAAIPFFRNSLAGDALYSALLFGGLALAERQITALREPGAMIHNEH